jgi:hypothetical protein
MNIRYVEGIEEVAPLLHLRLASFDRAQEPPEVKAREGGTLAWGVARVMEALQPWEARPTSSAIRARWARSPCSASWEKTPGGWRKRPWP